MHFYNKTVNQRDKKEKEISVHIFQYAFLLFQKLYNSILQMKLFLLFLLFLTFSLFYVCLNRHHTVLYTKLY
nr:hypothetical protein Itr_chr10CG05460 [Ipomoea trifida]